jgi:hypothetical protein
MYYKAEVGPVNSDATHILREELHLPIVPALEGRRYRAVSPTPFLPRSVPLA